MLDIKNLTKYHDKFKVLDSLNLKVERGEVVVVIGPSGSGKSTILRCVAKLDQYDDGEIAISTENEYKVGMVFQNFNLFPHLTVLENLTYAPIKVLKFSKDKAKSQAYQMLEQVGLQESADKYPNSLSGGQKQRVAIARTLCMHPELILIDEPTSALDPENVKEVLGVIKKYAHTGITLVIVTHEMQFAKEIADRIAFIDKGRLIEIASPAEIFLNPKSERLQIFLKNIL